MDSGQFVWQSFKILAKAWLKIQRITGKHATERWCALPDSQIQSEYLK